MSSDIQSALELLVLHNYLSLVVATAVVYDYLLTFSKEIEYFWVRYIGLCWVVIIALYGTSFIPGPLETYVS
ncbi:hypothetical protein L210DRAFT_3755840 [Boletus edulis BED1]|uniref:DUF6533 domain-containing protein n=1 Tax=Boletus edulis BED1 TaxID=1328754 RepID=A0AAD4CA33_BOLED|nr:hypothetical protein L210DRAFT_3755840 [Boletus edulis BED1]